MSTTKRTLAEDETAAVNKRQRLDAASASSGSGVRTVPEILNNPCGYYLSKVKSCTNTNCISFADIVRWHSDRLVESIHFNFMFELDWLVYQYDERSRTKPMHLVVGHSDRAALLADVARFAGDNLKIFVTGAPLPIPFGTHHTKMTLLHYHDGLRVVISTANMIERDWTYKTQGVYLTRLLPYTPNAADSTTAQPSTRASPFRDYLLTYLRAYGKNVVPTKWIDYILAADFDSVQNVHLIGSVPGAHPLTAAAGKRCVWGVQRMHDVLASHAAHVPSTAPLIAQFSSIGSLGGKCDQWLRPQLAAAMGAGSGSAPLHLIYPSVSCVRSSLEGYAGGGSLPYRSATAVRQPYLTTMMHEWHADAYDRSRAIPHIKSYARVDQRTGDVYWMLLTSANLSKAAWGERQKNNTQLTIRSYELGVLFLPPTSGVADGDRSMRLPFDYPLVKYVAGTHEPWLADGKYTVPDVHGCVCNAE